MKYDISKMSIEEKIGQMLGLSFNGTSYQEELDIIIKQIKAGLIIYFKDNCKDLKEIFDLNKRILKEASIPPFISLDQEGGMVARITEGIVQSPGAMPISASKDKEAYYKLAYNMGCDLKRLGFNFNFAPVADVNNNPLNPVINVRSYSDDPSLVSFGALESVRGYTDSGLMTTLKHFPGHGDTAVDSHLGLPILDFDLKRMNDIELVPFINGINCHVPGIMASHVMMNKIDDKYPTTLSNKMITGLLRNTLGFNGLVVTDSLTMKAVWGRYTMEEIVLNGFNSGCDILLLCGARDISTYLDFYNIAIQLAKSGDISIDKINESVERILKYKEMFKTNMASSFDDIKDKLNGINEVEYSKKISLESVTLVKNENSLLPIKSSDKTLFVFPKIKVVTLVENNDNLPKMIDSYLDFHVDSMYISISPDENESSILLAKCDKYDKIIYCSYNACFNESQSKLINSIDQKKLICIALRTPYDLDIINASVLISSYEASPLAFTSLARVLTCGKATGSLPIKLNNY